MNLYKMGLGIIECNMYLELKKYDQKNTPLH